MKRGRRYWLWNAEESFIMLLLMAVIFTFVFSILNDIWRIQEIGGFSLMFLCGILMIASSGQAGQLMSISLKFGATRKSSFRGLQLMTFVLLVQIELVQGLLLLVPGINRRVQMVCILYTPVLWLVTTGIGYLGSILQEHSQKMFKGFTIGAMTLSGVAMGVCSAVVSEGKSITDGICRMLNGTIWWVAAVIALVIYGIGIILFYRESQQMDVIG